MEIREGSLAAEHQAIQPEGGGSIPTPSLQASELWFELCEYDAIKPFVIEHHYRHSLNGVTNQYCFKALHLGRLVGAIVYGWMSTTAWKKFGTVEHKVIELRRLVFLDEAGKNSESRFIAWTLRWLTKNTDIEIVVSYADPAHGHTGVVYKAANFEYRGLSTKDIAYFDPETGKTHHSRSLRTKNSHGEYKPFVKRLREKYEQGKLVKIDLPGKHCYTRKLR